MVCFLLNNNDKSYVHQLYIFYDTCQPGFCIFHSHPPSISYYSNIITMSLNRRYCLYMVVSGTFMDYFIVIYLLVFIYVLLIESIYLLYIVFPILCTAIVMYYYINHMRFQICMWRISIHLVPHFPILFHKGIGFFNYLYSICATSPLPQETTPNNLVLLCYYILYLLGKLFDIITRP